MPKAKTSSKRPPATSEPAQQPPSWPRFKPALPVADLAPQLHPATSKIALIPSFFPRSLCRDFVAFLRTLPLQTTPGRPKRGEATRVNDRFQVDDGHFARRLWEETGLKEALTLSDDVRDLWGGEPVGLNANIRVYRYTTGQFFDCHYDDDNDVDVSTDPPTPARTTWTLLLYLTSSTEGCVGGETVFYTRDRKSPAEAIVVPPETGLLLLHKHGADCLLVGVGSVLCSVWLTRLQHEGREVTAGEKWVLRTDICVRRIDRPSVYFGLAESLADLAGSHPMSRPRDSGRSAGRRRSKLQVPGPAGWILQRLAPRTRALSQVGLVRATDSVCSARMYKYRGCGPTSTLLRQFSMWDPSTGDFCPPATCPDLSQRAPLNHGPLPRLPRFAPLQTPTLTNFPRLSSNLSCAIVPQQTINRHDDSILLDYAPLTRTSILTTPSPGHEDMSYHGVGGPQRPYPPPQPAPPRGYGERQMPQQQHGGPPRGQYDDGYGHYGPQVQRHRPGPEPVPHRWRSEPGRGAPGPQTAVPRGPSSDHGSVRRPQMPHGPDSYPGPPRDYHGHGGYDEQGPDRSQFVPPGRSMTMPSQDAVRQGAMQQPPPPPHRADTMPYHDPAGRGGGVPPRPSTATGSRPPPRRMLPPQPQGQPQEWHGRGYRQETSEEGFDSYFAQPGPAEAEGRGPPPDPRRGAPHQMPRLHHAKSEANFREPQMAVFEMPAEVPMMPAVPPIQAYQPEYAGGYGRGGGGGGGGFEPMGSRGPPPPGHANGQHRFHGYDPRPGTAPPQQQQQMSSPDALPSHPTPVRPGHMANSMVSVNDRPPPVRNYGGVPQNGPPQQQQQQQLQQAPPQQGRVAVRAGLQVPEPAMTGQLVTPSELEQLRMAIKHNANDHDSALMLARKLVEAADVLIANIPDAKQRARTRERYLMDAHKILKKLANAQNQEAMFIMADGLGRGLFGHEPDNKEAFALYHSAAKLGHAAAAYRTAVCCEIGQEEGGGTRKDPLKAMQWYRRAATLGDPPAMYKVGMILLKGLLGQNKNPREAVGWLRRAAERANEENPHALHELGLLYESAQSNDVIIRDERYALSLFQDAADLGYKFSQFRLGCAFEYGLMGCPIDPRQSIFWYSKAAAQAEHQSELALSGWYLTGSDGVLGQSDTEAYLWARKAAVAGLAKAEYAMGYFTEVGIGVPANLEDAKRWYWRAAAQEFPKARERLEDLKRAGKHGRPRERERISRSRIERQQEGECSVM
ncbi:hypothetical protein CDD80_3126 [Ophiocordyceps camponoti-rufipedis]|uniref:Fe2OG dioxygenase domain-containing protein n=1 Tax=Ophiocordyceps camponoti-rufipedis TaxID=2004952 RepID=A0A2C5YXS0_9HYPO|nr:hypothetical protein CDD80_3126 [Ophiocordyceps camponoti-rufipedis]